MSDLFTKPKRSRLSPCKKATRQPLAIAKGKTSDVDAGFAHFQRSHQTAPRVTR